MRFKTVNEIIKGRAPIYQVIVLVSTTRLMMSPFNYVNQDIMKYWHDNKEVREIYHRLWSLYSKLRHLGGTVEPFV